MSQSVVEFRRATPADAIALAANIREADRQEIIATSGPDILGAVERSMRVTPDCMAAVLDGEIAAVFGVAPLVVSSIGSPWLLGATTLDRIPGALTRNAQAYLRSMLRAYPLLLNYVDARNVASLRWLRRLGFTILPPAPHGVLGLPFHRFEMRGWPCVPRA